MSGIVSILFGVVFIWAVLSVPIIRSLFTIFLIGMILYALSFLYVVSGP